MPQHIENLYEKRFKREQPEVIKSLKQQLKEDEIKRIAKKKAKNAKRAAKATEESQCSPEVIEDSEDIVQLGLDSCVKITSIFIHFTQPLLQEVVHKPLVVVCLYIL